eukprot:g7676.t1
MCLCMCKLRGKTDKKFVEIAFRVFRDVLELKLVLTSGQFLQQGFAERKLLLLCEVLEKCRKLHEHFIKQKRLQALKVQNYSRGMKHCGMIKAPRIEKGVVPFVSLTNTWMNPSSTPGRENTSPSILQPISVESGDVIEKNVKQCSLPIKDLELECGSVGDFDQDELASSSSTSLIENLEAVRDPLGIKPLAKTRNEHTPKVVLELAEKVRILEQELEDLKETFVSELQQILNRYQEPSTAVESLLNRITQLETRVKFLEAESHKPQPESENRRKEISLTPHLSYAESVEAESCANHQEKRTLQDIITDLTTRQNSAESFLKQCRNLEQ